ncbi:MAG: hypothetical protein ACFCUQ_20905 [Kiloniellales bacterium]
MFESIFAWLGLAYLAIGIAFAWLADHAAIRELPAWYRRERIGWLALFALFWPLCLGLLLLAWRWAKDDGPGANPGKDPQTPVNDAARSRHPAAAGPVRWP